MMNNMSSLAPIAAGSVSSAPNLSYARKSVIPMVHAEFSHGPQLHHVGITVNRHASAKLVMLGGGGGGVEV